MSRDGVDLLVASAGGHLAQLHVLAQRLEPRRPQVWVTYDHPQAASLLRGCEVVHGAGPSSRSVTAALRNWRLAGRLVSPTEVARVVSTGAAISVPFLLRAALRGVEGHYIESATRTDGPSLSGRILERTTRRTALHTQHAGWSGGRWRAIGSVFDGFAAVPGPTPPDEGLRVVVSLGTHRFAFTRVLEQLAPALRETDEVVLQHGATPPLPLPGSVRAVHNLPAEDFEDALTRADVVVGHAGTGLALTSLRHGHVPVLFARTVRRGEHVDDHQELTARLLGQRGLAVVAGDGPLDRSLLLRAAGTEVEQPPVAAPLRLRVQADVRTP